ncbi:hypothetical protein [Methylorubrum sp. POS3]|uniref:hypothetical protein n=1 Tax=Methylorubrum sp. POS3 TaxID=2998492 RepID=UPI0037263D4F
MAAAGIILITTFQAVPQYSIPRGSVEINLDKATDLYKLMIDQTCYRQRHSLQNLVRERPTSEFTLVPRQYPYYDEKKKRTLLAEWGIFTRSGPYLVTLYDNNEHDNITSCVVHTVAVQKNALKDTILQIDGLYFVDEIEENGMKIFGFRHKKERGLRVLCMISNISNDFTCECHLWSWPEDGS